jgi:hypothetical protein
MSRLVVRSAANIIAVGPRSCATGDERDSAAIQRYFNESAINSRGRAECPGLAALANQPMR